MDSPSTEGFYATIQSLLRWRWKRAADARKKNVAQKEKLKFSLLGEVVLDWDDRSADRKSLVLKRTEYIVKSENRQSTARY